MENGRREKINVKYYKHKNYKIWSKNKKRK